jgi:DeoR family fructose operon transcriptional repressor
MYAEERQQAIAGLVTRNRRVSVSQAAEAFGVTTETVRRDLAILEQQGLIRRVHGGAVSADALTVLEPNVPERDRAATEQKDRIAKAAVAMLPPSGGSVVLDAGTSTGRLAGRLPVDQRLTIVTNGVAIAALLTGRASPQVDVHLLGGRVRAISQATVGPAALRELDAIRADVAFIGTNGLHLEHGLTTPDADEAAVKSAMIRAGRRVVVLADSRKFGEETMVRFGTLDLIDAVITDDGVDESDVKTLESFDIEVVVA